MDIRVTLDRSVDAAYIYLVPIGPGEAVRTEVLDMERRDGSIHIDFNRDGQMIGIEVLGASSVLPPLVLAAAEPLGS